MSTIDPKDVKGSGKHGFLVIIILCVLILMIYSQTDQSNPTNSKFIGKQIEWGYYTDKEGNEVKPKGPAILHFFDSSCTYCKNDHELFKRMKDRKEIRIYGVDIDEKRGDFEDFVDNNPTLYDGYLYPENPAGVVELGIKGIPVTIIFDENSKIIYYYGNSLNEKQLENEIINKLKVRSDNQN